MVSIRLWIRRAIMSAVGEVRREQFQKSRAEIFVEKQLHPAVGAASLRSRAAANSRAARTSSRDRDGKSRRMSSSDIPPARYSRMSYTVMRVPLMQGLPLRTPGSMTMRFS